MPTPITEVELAGLVHKTPADIVAFFKAKGHAFSWDWRDVWQEEHARAFTVAKAARKDILDVLRKGVDQAVASGWSAQRFERELTPVLQKLGWWGRQTVINPAGVEEIVQLGSPWRLNTIYRTNTSVSFGRGRYALMKANAINRPYWMYDAVNDSVTRDSHRALDNHVYRHDDPIWDRIYPPCGFNCRCVIRALTADQVKARGLEVRNNPQLPDNFPDAGWDFNPAQQTVGQLAAKLET